nr:hypothetical protein [Planctomycetota bacterium]
MTDPYAHPDTAAVIAQALLEDLRDTGDLTCRVLVPPTARLSGVVRAKAPGVVCGLALFQMVFDRIANG